MAGQTLLLLSDHASYMTGGEYFVDGCVFVPGFFRIVVALTAMLYLEVNSFGKEISRGKVI